MLRHLNVRDKHRDVIRSMMLLRLIGEVLESTNAAVLAMKATLDAAGITN